MGGGGNEIHVRSELPGTLVRSFIYVTERSRRYYF